MTLIVQLRLRKTHNFVGARSSCSMGCPSTVSISPSLNPIRWSTPWVPTSAVAAGLASSAAGAAALRAGAGARGGVSAAPAVPGPVTSSGMLVRSSAGGEDSTQPAVSKTAANPM